MIPAPLAAEQQAVGRTLKSDGDMSSGKNQLRWPMLLASAAMYLWLNLAISSRAQGFLSFTALLMAVRPRKSSSGQSSWTPGLALVFCTFLPLKHVLC